MPLAVSRRPPGARLLVLSLLGALVLLALPSRADVLTTTDGLVLEGGTSRDEGGNWVIETSDGRVVLPAARVAGVRAGDGVRTRLDLRCRALAATDADGWYRLALEAEAAGLADLVREAHEHVVALRPDHAASRRALGQEKVDGEWVSVEAARRRRGLVLYEGRWMLPAEVEAVAREEQGDTVRPPADGAHTREAIRTWATAGEALRRAAQRALARVPRERRLRAARVTLYDADPKVRAISARLLGELGDESALRPLVFSGARDVNADVRREAVLAAASFGHDDVAIPYVRALGSKNLRLVANAAEALAAIDDPRALGFIVKRLTSHGSSARCFIAFLNQVSYVRDYDVEIAQASNIANPDIATILDGVILDVRVLDATYTKTWVEPLLVEAASSLAGRRFVDREGVLAWYAEAKDTLEVFPHAPAKRAPRKRPGRGIGAPAIR